MISHDAKSIDGWVLKGDALSGSGERQEALDAYRKALVFFDKKYGKPDKRGHTEAPEYILDRIRELRESPG